MSPKRDPCGQHLLIHGAGTTAYVVPLSKGEFRRIGLVQQKAGDDELGVGHVFHELGYYEPGTFQPVYPSPPDVLRCPSCGRPLRRHRAGRGWDTGRCEELRRGDPIADTDTQEAPCPT